MDCQLSPFCVRLSLWQFLTCQEKIPLAKDSLINVARIGETKWHNILSKLHGILYKDLLISYFSVELLYLQLQQNL